MRQYERSGLTIRQFCEQEGLVTHQLSWWRSELKRRDAKPSSIDKRGSNQQSAKRTRSGHGPKSHIESVRRFVPVEIQPSPRDEASIEIILDHPPRLRVSSGFDAELLREVVGVLEQR
jgi:hypothetical protein